MRKPSSNEPPLSDWRPLFALDDLNPVERRILEARSSGRPVDVSTGVSAQDDPAQGSAWDASRDVRAAVLRQLLIGENDLSPAATDVGIELKGAAIRGILNLAGTSVLCSLSLTSCFFEGTVELAQASLVDLCLDASFFPRVKADDMVVTGGLSIRNAHATGGVSLSHCTIRGSVDLSNSSFEGSNGGSVTAEQLRVGGSLYAESLRAEGEVNLRGAEVEGSVSLASASLLDADESLTGDGMRVRGSCFLSQRFDARGTVRLIGADIGGIIDLDGGTFTARAGAAISAERVRVGGDLLARGVRADGEVSLVAGRVGGMMDSDQCKLQGSRVALAADGLEVAGDVSLTGQYQGEVRLIGARIGRALDCARGTFSNSQGRAVDASEMSVGGSIFAADIKSNGAVWMADCDVGGDFLLSGGNIAQRSGFAFCADRIKVHGSLQIAEDFVVDGGISLRAASIGGALDCTAATLVAGSNGYALYADRMRVGADLFFAGGFLAKGQILLEFAVVHGDFDCRQGTIEHEHRTALDAAQLTVKGDVLCCDTFFSKGTATFVGAAVDGKIDFTDARLVNGTALALSLERVAVRGNLSLKAATIDGGVDLRFASVGAFEDHARVQPTEVLIEGFTYRSIDGRDVNERLKWLDEYSKNSPQPYEQLARAYREQGREEDARQTAVRKRRQRRKERNLAGRVWDGALDWGVGYGYHTWRVFLWLAAILAVGSVTLAVAHHHHMFRAIRPSGQRPDFSPVTYALDTTIPVINLNERVSYAPKGYALGIVLFLTVGGWLLVTLLVAAVSGLTRRE